MVSVLTDIQNRLGRAVAPGGGHQTQWPESPGLVLTRRVQRSWCEGRAINAARMVLSLLPPRQRRELVNDYVDGGGGTAAFLSTEAAAILPFLAARLPDPSHALSFCRMELGLMRARDGVSEPALPTRGNLRQGRHATMIGFHADPAAIVAALDAHQQLPPVGRAAHFVLFAPGLPNLFRAATPKEVAVWNSPAAAARGPITDRMVAEQILEQVS
jgi:hypothetical protein